MEPKRTEFPKVFVEDEKRYFELLKGFASGCCPVADYELSMEYQGRGNYEPVVWTARPEGTPLFCLKWVSP